METGEAAARQSIRDAIARAILPDPPVDPVAWAAGNFRLVDGPKAGALWDPDESPWMIEILRHMALDHPTTRAALRKSAQIGFTTGAIAWLMATAALTPTQMMVVQPTTNAVRGFNKEKFDPAIRACRALDGIVAGDMGPSDSKSSAFHKSFPGGFIVLVGANSAPDLSAKTIRVVLADEVDRWPHDLDGQGDPMRLVDARQQAFKERGGWKRLEGGTPTIEGQSRIDTAFEGGDQRYWLVDCPGCGAAHRLEWEGLVWSRETPQIVHHRCPECGTLVPESERRGLVRRGRFVAHNPDGAYPSWHIDGLYALPWPLVVRAYLEAESDPTALKAFWNLTLGRSWRAQGEAPEAERLHARALGSGYRRGTLPPGVLYLTAGADVQADRIEVEIVGWGTGGTSWQVDYRVIGGDTADAATWARLTELYQETWTDHLGHGRVIESIAIDSGYRPQQVYRWCMGKDRALAVKGVGEHLAPLLSTPTKQVVVANGRKSGSVLLHKVGTWQIKAEVYGLLNLNGPNESGGYPVGWCHFPEDSTIGYFQGLTSETLVDKIVRGGVRKEWIVNPRVRNEPLDCRVYARAAAESHALRWRGLKPMSLMTPADWQVLAANRGAPPEIGQLELLAAVQGQPARPETPVRRKPRPERESWITGGGDWFRR